MRNLFVVVDMQNDFISGALANPSALAIVNPMVDFFGNVSGDPDENLIVTTQDTHYKDYLDTYEGQHLPIPHCIAGTQGWELDHSLEDIITAEDNFRMLTKNFFNAGESKWSEVLSDLEAPERIFIMGTCTDICVISNAFTLKALFPNTDIYVISDLCAGLTPEKHAAALDVMASCQFIIINAEKAKELIRG